MANTIRLNGNFFSNDDFNIENTANFNENTSNILELLNEVENNSKDIKIDLNSNDETVIKLNF